MGSLQHGALIRALLTCLGGLALILPPQLSHAAPEPAADGVLLSACEDAADFSPARTPDDPSFDFAAWEATVFAGARVKGSSLRWHLVPATAAQSSARLALARPLRDRATEIAVWVKNPNAHELSLRLEVIDADGARYQAPPADLAGELGWREIVFDLRAASGPDTDPCPGLDAPFTRIALLLDGLVAGRPHTIYLDEITARRAGAPAITVANLRCQTSLGPGERAPIHAELSPASALADARVSAQLTTTGGAVLWQEPVRVESTEGERARVTAAVRVPEWLRPGRYEVRLASSFAEIAGGEPAGVVVGGSPPGPAAAAVVAGLSPPALQVDGEAYPPLIEEVRGEVPAALSAGAKIVAVPATTDSHPFVWAPTAADDSGEVGFAGLDRRAASVLNRSPRSALILQVFLNATPDWAEANAGHLQRFGGEAQAPPQVFALSRSLPDIVSKAWQRDAEARLRRLVRHVAASAWGHRVIGYELQAGDLGAWRPWGASLGIGDETTPVRHDAFLGWLHGRYPSVDDLRDGWLGRRRGFGQARQGFESVEVPEPLPDAPEPSLYDPSADQPMIDLLQFRAEAAADALIAMAAAVREEAGEGVLVGGCYGHLLAQARANDWSWPHTALSRVLESGAVDFLTGPQHRIDDAREPSSVGESARRAGVLYLERVNGGEEAPADCGALVPAGEAGALAGSPAPAAPAPGATVIEVIDDLSARYLSGDAALPRELLTRPIAGWIAHSTCLLRDLLGPNPPQASVYIFRDLFTIEPEQGRLLGRNTARDGSLLIWVYAPGAIDRHLITGRTMQYLTGIKLAPLARRGKLVVTPESGLLSPFGFREPVSPWFMSADERAEWLGTIRSGNSDFCGFALRTFPHCTSVFAAAPPTEEAVRRLAERTRIELVPGG